MIKSRKRGLLAAAFAMASHYPQVCQAITDNEITDFANLKVEVSQRYTDDTQTSLSSYNYEYDGQAQHQAPELIDNDYFTGVIIPPNNGGSDSAGQFLFISWFDQPDYLRVGALWLHIDEQYTTSGTIHFQVATAAGYVQVPADLYNGVGVDGKGGVLNLGGYDALAFYMYCDPLCLPNLVITEVKLWRQDAVSVGATFYTLAGQDGLLLNCTPDMLIGAGSIIGSLWNEVCYVQNDASDKIVPGSFGLQFATLATVHEIVTVSQPYTAHANYVYFLDGETITAENILSADAVQVNDPMDAIGIQTIEVGSLFTATDFGATMFNSDTNAKINFVKVILLGEFYDLSMCDQSIEPLATDIWTPPVVQILSEPGVVTSFTAPTFKSCEQAVASADLQFEFLRVDAVSGTLTALDFNFVSYDSDDDQIYTEATTAALKQYIGETVLVMIRATAISTGQQNDATSFTVFFENFIETLCNSSEILELDFEGPWVVMVLGEEFIYEISETTDSGTIAIQAFSGYESESCGTIDYEVLTLPALVQKSGMELTVATQDPALVGEQTLLVKISLRDYQNAGSTFINVQITVESCIPLELLPQEGAKPLSPLQLVFSLPQVFTVDLPLFEPSPLCDLSNADLVYKVIGDDDLPPWATFAQDERSIDFDIQEDPSLPGTSVPITIEASYGSITQEMSFAVSFLKSETSRPTEVDPEPVQPDDEENEEVVQEPTQESSWDGWKILLAEQLLADLNIQLPPPNPDPKYVPTPPIPSLELMSNTGATRIQFSEDVFEYPDLKNMRVPRPPPRNLQTSITVEDDVDFETVKFIELFVDYDRGKLDDPGFNPEKLTFDYDINFVGPRTIEINVKWADPVHISASLPADELVIRFNGPFFDTQDGIDIDQAYKEIRSKLPPQVVPGGITNAIQGTGDSLQIMSTTSLASNAAINVFFAGSLSQVWGMINNLQLLVHSPLINVQFPANAFMLFDVMISVATFEILPTDDIFPVFFSKLPEDSALTDNFDRMNFGSRYLVMNLGTMFLILSGYLVLYLLYPIFNFLKNDSQCSAKMQRKLQAILFWNHAIIFLQEGYLDIVIGTSINLAILQEGQLQWSTWTVVFTNLLTIFLLVCCIALFLVTVGYLWPNFSQLKTKAFKTKYFPAYEMLNLRHGPWTMLWPVFFMLRRILLVLGVVLLIEYPTMQILMFMVPTFAVMVLLAVVGPLSDRRANWIEIYNCITLLCLSYCLLTFTPFVNNPETKYKIGFFVVFLTVQSLVINIYFVGQDPARVCQLRCKNKWSRRHSIKRQLVRKAHSTSLWKACCSKKSEAKEVLESEDSSNEISSTMKQVNAKKALETINELSSSESLDSDIEIQVELEQMHADEQRAKFISSDDPLQSQLIDKMNSEAVKILEMRAELRLQATKMAEERAKAAALAKEKVDQIKDRFAYGTGQNPILTKYKLPYIEDLVGTLNMSQLRKRNESTHTLSGLQRKAKELSQLGASSSCEEFALIEAKNPISSEESVPPTKRRILDEPVVKPEGNLWFDTGKIPLKTFGPPATSKHKPPTHDMGSTQVAKPKHGWVQDGTSDGDPVQNSAGNALQIDERDDYNDYTQIQLWPESPLLREPSSMGESAEAAVKGLWGQSQTIMMADGVCVLFPELYTQTYGIGENKNKEGPSTAVDPTNSNFRGIHHQGGELFSEQKNPMEKKRRSKKEQNITSNSLFKSEKTSIRQSDQLGDPKRDMRLKVMTYFTLGVAAQQTTASVDHSAQTKQSALAIRPFKDESARDKSARDITPRDKGKQARKLFDKGIESSSESFGQHL